MTCLRLRVNQNCNNICYLYFQLISPAPLLQTSFLILNVTLTNHCIFFVFFYYSIYSRWLLKTKSYKSIYQSIKLVRVRYQKLYLKIFLSFVKHLYLTTFNQHCIFTRVIKGCQLVVTLSRGWTIVWKWIMECRSLKSFSYHLSISWQEPPNLIDLP